MLDQLYVQPAVVARHRAAPCCAERERFLTHCAERGYNRTGLRKIAWMLFVIVNSLFIGERAIPVVDIERAAYRYVRGTAHRGRDHCRTTQQLFIRIATAWLEFLGRLAPRTLPRFPFARELELFERFLRDERGLSAVTIRSRCQRVDRFLHTLKPDTRSIGQITTRQIDRYLVQQSDHGWSRASLGALASDLRSFFRYAEAQHWCQVGIAAAIDSPRIYHDEGLPRGPDWEQVQALIASTSGDDPVSIRDRAIVVLLALYGLRRGEVAGLRLEDIDWQGQTLQIVGSKHGRVQRYPLIQIAGDALVRYVCEVRPHCPHRQVFLAMKAPLRPLSSQSITPIVCWRFAALGVRSSPHGLRHACAQHLLTQGFSLSEIGDQLGHRSVSATRYYAKVDLCALRQVAELDLGWLP